MAKLEGKMAELNDAGGRLWDDLDAILSEHLPAELLGRVRELVDKLQGNAFSQSFVDLAQLYRALVALMPDNQPQIRAAFQATVFEHDRNDEADWKKLEQG